MSLTPSKMPDLGLSLPAFELPDIDGRMISPATFHDARALLVAFWCNHCPYVIHVTDIVLEIAEKYGRKGFNFAAISSNDVGKYPQDGPEHMRKLAEERQYPFPYLFDESQNVAKDYDAACTPDFYVFDRELKLVYRGQLDGSRPGNQVSSTGEDLTGTLDAIIMNKAISTLQQPSVGCNIKWR